ncbi:two-component sensor protein RcsD [Klebsiella michiganensis]|nr:two-component sensor protein RcsD [Klebsiella michiganensis]
MNARRFRRCATSPGQNGYYFTLRTTFNQPGHLATVVAFDLPINDLIPPSMSLESFRLEPDPSAERQRQSG